MILQSEISETCSPMLDKNWDPNQTYELSLFLTFSISFSISNTLLLLHKNFILLLTYNELSYIALNIFIHFFLIYFFLYKLEVLLIKILGGGGGLPKRKKLSRAQGRGVPSILARVGPGWIGMRGPLSKWRGSTPFFRTCVPRISPPL
jgi:hypothetical protein